MRFALTVALGMAVASLLGGSSLAAPYGTPQVVAGTWIHYNEQLEGAVAVFDAPDRNSAVDINGYYGIRMAIGPSWVTNFPGTPPTRFIRWDGSEPPGFLDGVLGVAWHDGPGISRVTFDPSAGIHSMSIDRASIRATPTQLSFSWAAPPEAKSFLVLVVPPGSAPYSMTGVTSWRAERVLPGDARSVSFTGLAPDSSTYSLLLFGFSADISSPQPLQGQFNMASDSVDFTGGEPPEISMFGPTYGPPGTAVDLGGKNFIGATRVTLCFTPAQFTVYSNTAIRAIVPEGACEGRWRVTTPNGTAVNDTVFPLHGPPPTVTGFTPASGDVASTVQINGTGFTGASEVSLCYVPTTYTVESDTSVIAHVPDGACDGRWRVTTETGTGASSDTFTLKSFVPTISAFSPATGAEGSTVTITGTNFSGVKWVSLCYADAQFTVSSDTSIVAFVPSGACDGRWRVSTSYGTGASDTTFTVSATRAPTVTGFSPTSGAVGSVVTITGSNFTGATAVTLCYVHASYTVSSDTTIAAVVPPGACEGRWRVTSPDGIGVSDTTFAPAFQPPDPTITGFSPSSGAVGSTVTITGTDFTGTTSVSLCFVPTTYTINSDTSITAVVPSGACEGRWRVANAHGTGQSSTTFNPT
jgi:hypothetical protein